jgi:hypothetical protein
MKSSGPFMAPERVFEKLCALCTERTVEGSTVLFRQGEAPKEVVLVLHGDIALTPDATERTLCRFASAGAVLGGPCHSGAEVLQPDRRFGQQVHHCHLASETLSCGASGRPGDDFGDCSNAGGRNFRDAELKCAVPTRPHERTGHPMKGSGRVRKPSSRPV